jgi:hypothetical protein
VAKLARHLERLNKREVKLARQRQMVREGELKMVRRDRGLEKQQRKIAKKRLEVEQQALEYQSKQLARMGKRRGCCGAFSLLMMLLIVFLMGSAIWACGRGKKASLKSSAKR